MFGPNCKFEEFANQSTKLEVYVFYHIIFNLTNDFRIVVKSDDNKLKVRAKNLAKTNAKN